MVVGLVALSGGDIAVDTQSVTHTTGRARTLPRPRFCRMAVAAVVSCVVVVDGAESGSLYCCFAACSHLERCLRRPLLVSNRWSGHQGHWKERVT